MGVVRHEMKSRVKSRMERENNVFNSITSTITMKFWKAFLWKLKILIEEHIEFPKANVSGLLGDLLEGIKMIEEGS